MESLRQAVVQLDHSLRLWIVTHRIGSLNPVFWFASAIGRGGIVWMVLGLALMVKRRLRPGALIELGRVA